MDAVIESEMNVPVVGEIVRTDEISAHPQNYNRHNSDQIGMIAASLRKFGQVRSIVVWRKTILAGTGVWTAAKLLGWPTLRANVLPDDYPAELADAYLSADNEIARRSDPDLLMLAALLERSQDVDPELPYAMGFTNDDYLKLLEHLEETQAANVETASSEIFSDFGEPLEIGTSVTFKFGTVSGQVSKEVFESFLEEYTEVRADSGEILLDNVLRSWLGLGELDEMGASVEDDDLGDDFMEPGLENA